MPTLPFLRLLLALTLLAVPLAAQIPPGYYATVDTSSAARLRSTLHEVIDDHRKLPYTSSSLDTWDVLESAQADPNAAGRILDIYRNRSFRSGADRVSGYNREHTWPQSHGITNDGPDNAPYTDCHHLFLAEVAYNTARSNKPFDACTVACSEYPTDANDGAGGGSGNFPGWSNWTSGSFEQGRWQVWRRRQGDIARAMLYLDVRYEGGTHGGTGQPEPDLQLTDDRNRITIDNSNNLALARSGLLSALLQWHADDPVDAWERHKNDVVFGAQGNRNPFIDHPEWVDVLWGQAVPGSFTTYGTGCASSNGFTPAIGALGAPYVGSPITLTLSVGPANQPAVLNLDPLRRSIDLSVLGLIGCSGYALGILPVETSTNLFGSAATTIPVPLDNRLVGATVQAQWFALDPAGAGLTASGGAELRLGRR